MRVNKNKREKETEGERKKERLVQIISVIKIENVFCNKNK